jgi:hypothetical protein
LLCLQVVIGCCPISTSNDDQQVEAGDHSAAEHIIMIGSSRLTSLYIKMLQAHAPAQRHVVAVLDDNQKLFGRTMCGVPVVGAADQLDAVIEEFAVHGVDTDRVLVGGDETLLSTAALDAVRAVCAERDIVLDFVPNLIGLAPLPHARQPSVQPGTVTTIAPLSPCAAGSNAATSGPGIGTSYYPNCTPQPDGSLYCHPDWALVALYVGAAAALGVGIWALTNLKSSSGPASP